MHWKGTSRGGRVRDLYLMLEIWDGQPDPVEAVRVQCIQSRLRIVVLKRYPMFAKCDAIPRIFTTIRGLITLQTMKTNAAAFS